MFSMLFNESRNLHSSKSSPNERIHRIILNNLEKHRQGFFILHGLRNKLSASIIHALCLLPEDLTSTRAISVKSSAADLLYVGKALVINQQ